MKEEYEIGGRSKELVPGGSREKKSGKKQENVKASAREKKSRVIQESRF